MSTSWFKGMSSTYQYSVLVCLCNNSDKILALSLQQCNDIITSNNNRGVEYCHLQNRVFISDYGRYHLIFALPNFLKVKLALILHFASGLSRKG